jgi:hypothetical protein
MLSRHRGPTRVFLAIAVLAGSRAAVAAVADAGADASAKAVACTSEVATLATWIKAAPREGNVLLQSPDLRLVEPAQPALPPDDRRGAMLEVGARRAAFKFELEELDNPAQLRTAMNHYRQRGDRQKGPSPIVVAIDRDAKWSLVSAALNAAGAAGFSPVELAFARVSPITAPPPALAPATERILRIDDPFERSREAAVWFNEIAKPCPQAREVMNHLSGGEARNKVNVLVSELAPALGQCHCAASPVDMMQVVWLFLEPSEDRMVRRSFVGARITVAPQGAPAAVVRAKEDAPWADVYRRLLDAAKSKGEPPAVRLAIGSP